MDAPTPRPHSTSTRASHWTEWLWADTDGGRAANALRTVLQFALALSRELAGGQLSLRAASLVYTTILSIVPLLALSFSVLKGLGVHRRLEPLLTNFLAPLGPQAEQITERIIGFVDNVEGSVLAGLSLALLLLTTLSLAQKIEASFNYVWRIRRPRSLTRRISDYLSLVLIGPLVMSVSVGLMATLMDSSMVARLRATEPFGSTLAALGQLTPYALVIVSFAFLYAFLPNTRVRLLPAAIGGVFGGALWVGSGYFFAAFVAASGRNEAIYSGFAAVIAAMLWLYVSWLVLLLGAQLAFFAQNPFWLRHAAPGSRTTAGARESTLLAGMLEIARRFSRGDRPLRPEQLAKRLRIPRHELEPALDELERAALIERTRRGELLPSRDLRHIRLAELVTIARRPHDALTPAAGAESLLKELYSRVDAAIEHTLGDETLANLLAAAPDPEPGPTDAAPGEATAPRA